MQRFFRKFRECEIPVYLGTSRLRAALGALCRGPGPREIIIRAGGRVSYIPLSRARQFFAILVIGAAGAWIGHASFSYFDLQRIIEGKDRDIVQAGKDNQDLLAKMTEMREQFSDVAGTLDRNHRDLANLLKQNHILRGELSDVGQNLSTSENTLADSRRLRSGLDRQFAGFRAEMKQVEALNRRLVGNLDITKTKLIESIATRSKLDTVRRTLKERVAGLEQRLAQVKSSQDNLLGRVTAKAVKDLKTAERIISRAGLNITRLLRRVDSDAYAQGGPFIAAGRGVSVGFADGVAIFDRHMERLDDVRDVMRRLPLARPLGTYRMASRFGRRRDPINRKWARHDGVDLAGKLRSPVMAPAPGKVIYAGWKGRYGRLITIDHGLGIKTRYGHLRRLHVKRGQTVKIGQMIGQLGNSGRSTGAHLHYEILVDGKPVNPIKFIKAGKDVFKG